MVRQKHVAWNPACTTSSFNNQEVPNDPQEEAIIKFNMAGSKEYSDLFTEQTFTSEKALSFDSLADAIPNMAQQLTDRMWLKLI